MSEEFTPDATEEVRQLLSLGLAGGLDDPPLTPGTRFGDYELGEVLGRGGMGVVYRARHVGIRRSVALKLIRSGELASEGELLRFRAEAAANLDHPNIVPVFHFGECEGQPFFTMRLVEGGNLAEALERSRFTQRQAVALLATIARAVHHAHERAVLHRDLKPTNILLDEGGQPHVADFGIARRLGERANGEAPNTVSGHPDYMAPEQALGEPGGLTVAADVYGLGVIFYELLTRKLPDRGAVYELPVPPPSSVERRVTLDLDLICLKCLEREPLLRYESASQLAEDLERCLRGELPEVRARSRRAWLWRRLRQHPFLAIALTGAFFISVASAVSALWVIGSQERALRSEILKVNTYAAQATAGQVLFKIRELSDRLARCASHEEVAARIRGGLVEPEPVGTERLLRSCGAVSTFDSVRLLDESGVALTRFPVGKGQVGGHFSFREYFRGARRLGELGRPGVHVGWAIKSESDDQFKLSLAAPVFGDGRWVGVVLATIGTNSTLASLALPNDDRRMAVLVGLRDRERSEANLPDQHLVLVHQELGHGEAVAIAGQPLEKLAREANEARAGKVEQFELSASERTLADDQHRDPLLEGRWLAGFAPVGNTGFAVIVQTREAEAVAAIHAGIAKIVAATAGLFALGLGIVLCVARLISVRRRSALT